MKAIEVADITAALRGGVPAYASANIGIEQLDIAHLQFLTNDVEILKLRWVASTMRIMSQQGRQAPLSIVGTPWAFFPPIIEQEENGRMVIVDGVHRVLEAVQAQQGKIDAIVVRGVTAKLPGTPILQFEANVLARKRRREERL